MSMGFIIVVQDRLGSDGRGGWQMPSSNQEQRPIARDSSNEAANMACKLLHERTNSDEQLRCRTGPAPMFCIVAADELPSHVAIDYGMTIDGHRYGTAGGFAALDAKERDGSYYVVATEALKKWKSIRTETDSSTDRNEAQEPKRNTERHSAESTIDAHAPYFPPQYFKDMYEIPGSRLRQARREGRINAKRVGHNRWHYSEPDCRKLWPTDVNDGRK